MRTRFISAGLLVLFVLMRPSDVTLARTRQTENVVLVTLDGARWQEVFTGLDDSLACETMVAYDVAHDPIFRDFVAPTPDERRQKLMPFLWGTLITDHGFAVGDRTAHSAVSVTNHLWFSYPGYAEILTGQSHDDVITSNEPIRNPFPSVLQFLVRKLGLPPSQVATFASWGVISSIVESVPGSTTVNAGPQRAQGDSPELDLLNTMQQEARTSWDHTRHDAYTFRFALDYLKRHHPRVLSIAFDETDDWAHDNRYDQVLSTLHRTDGYLKTLWDALQGDPQYRDRTTLIVTTDHGRGRTAADWQQHGRDVPGSNEIWIAIASPDTTRRGVWQNSPDLFQNQIAETMAAVLGLSYRGEHPAAGAAIDLGASRPALDVPSTRRRQTTN